MDVRGGAPDVDAYALRSIRSSVLLSLISVVIVFVGLFAVIGVSGLVSSLDPTGLMAAATAGVGFLALAIVAAVLGIISLVLLRRGYKALRVVDDRFSLPYHGTTLMFVSLILTVIGLAAFIALLTALGSGGLGGLVLLASALYTLYVVFIIASVIALIGGILAYIVGSFRLGDRYGVGKFRTAGILFIIGLVLSFIGIGAVIILVALILMYMAVGAALSSRSPRP